MSIQMIIQMFSSKIFTSKCENPSKRTLDLIGDWTPNLKGAYLVYFS